MRIIRNGDELCIPVVDVAYELVMEINAANMAAALGGPEFDGHCIGAVTAVQNLAKIIEKAVEDFEKAEKAAQN